MKKLKKLTALLTAIGMVAAMSACGSDAASSATTASTGAADSAPAATEAAQAAEAPAEAGSAAETAAAGDETYLIGICQLVQHEALDAATQGFKDALTEKLGDKVKFDEQNASGDSANCSTIVNGFLSENVNLILANATRTSAGCCCRYFRYPGSGYFCNRLCHRTGDQRLDRYCGHQRFRYLRSGTSGSAGCHDQGAVPGCQEGRSAVLLCGAQLRLSVRHHWTAT